MEFPKTGKYLKRMRIKCGLTQQDVGDYIKCGNQFVSNYERGLCAPAINHIPPLCKLLGVSTKRVLDVYMMDVKENIIERMSGG